MTIKVYPEVYAILKCGVDGSKNLKSVWNLPQLPITEQFGNFDENYPNVDQDLMLCMDCGHLQLLNQLDPNFLYNVENYNFRTLKNNKILKEFEFIQKFISSLQIIPKEIRAIEIGASNFELAQFLMKRNEISSMTVCDPLFSNKSMYGVVEEEGGRNRINVIGKLVEQASDELKNFNINFVIGRHVLEHVQNPLQLLRNVLMNVDPRTIFVFEVPSLELLRKSLRFDAIFHQHCQYFDKASIQTLLRQLNCNLISIKYNYLGANGGSMLFAFTKQVLPNKSYYASISQINPKNKYLDLINEIRFFQNTMKVISGYIKHTSSRKIGYGASHMLATFNYHTDGALEELEFILDDDYLKKGMTYKNICIKIVHPEDILIDESFIIVPTSLENLRALNRKILKNYPNKVLSFPIF
jgi:hypothetical protein